MVSPETRIKLHTVQLLLVNFLPVRWFQEFTPRIELELKAKDQLALAFPLFSYYIGSAYLLTHVTP